MVSGGLVAIVVMVVVGNGDDGDVVAMVILGGQVGNE